MLRLLLLLLAGCALTGGGTISRDWNEVSIPGARIHTEHMANPPADYDNRTAVLEMGGRTLRGKDAMRAVAGQVTDPVALAKLSELFLDPVGGTLVLSPADAQGDPAAPRVAPPVITDGILVYWAWTGGMLHTVRRSRVDLKTFERITQTAWDLELEEDPIGVARKAPGGGVDILVKACARPGATAALTDLLATHPRAPVRAQAAWAMRTCHDPATVVGALQRAMEQDPDTEVRWKAADTLGELGPLAAPALPALEKAAQGGDDNLKFSARRAVEKIKPR